MKPTKRPSPKGAPQSSPGDGLDDMSAAFSARLQEERVHLATLSAALARAEESPAWIFQDLQFRAHKIRGGAAIFEMAEVASLACALEEAACAASMSNADNTDTAVWSTLVALVRLMGTLDGGEGCARQTEPTDPKRPRTAKRPEHRTA